MKHAMTPLALALVLALSATDQAGAGPPDAAPRYRFREGEKLAYVVEAMTWIETSGPGGTSSARMSQLIDLGWEVSQVSADGKATIAQTVGRIRFKAVAPEKTVEYDTADGAAPPDPKAKVFADRLNGLVGARLSATIDAQGRLADVRLVERPGAGRVARADGGGAGDPSSEAGFRRLMGQLIPPLPEAAPARGQSWFVKVTEKVPEGKTTTETRYAYEGTEQRGGRQVHKLALTAERKTANEAGETLRTSTGAGAAYLDPVAGRLVESSLRHTMALEAADPGPRLTRTVTETITLKLVEGAK